MGGYTYFIGVSLGEGAIPSHFWALARELAKREHQVVLLPWGAGAPAHPVPGNPAIYPWPSPRPTRLADALFLWRLVRRWKPHCLIGNFGAVNVMMLISWLNRVPRRVAWYHTLQQQILLDWQKSWLLLRYLTWRKKVFYRFCTHIVGNSRAAMEEVCKVFGVPPAKATFFYNSLEDPLTGLGVLPDRLTDRVLCVGRFHPCKGQDVLIQAAASVRRRVGRVHLRFLGRGPLLDKCKEMARTLGMDEICEFPGSVAHADVFREMAQAAVTVVPSRGEAFGLVALESMAVGTPVVASRVGGLAEIVRDEVDGFLVPPDDPDTLADRLAILLKDAALRERMGHNARQRFLEEFEQTRLVRKQADWFEEIVRNAAV